jgi:hypothetical protein
MAQQATIGDINPIDSLAYYNEVCLLRKVHLLLVVNIRRRALCHIVGFDWRTTPGTEARLSMLGSIGSNRVLSIR